MKNNITRLSFLFLCLTLFCLQVYAQGLKTPRPSPPAELKQTIGLTDIVVNYSRPQVIRDGKDRTGEVWGGPAWYGFMKAGNAEIPWRAGANENTTISFSDDVKVEGKKLKAGKYALYMAVFEDGKVTVIFSENSSRWGSYGYDPSEDALRVDVKAKESAFTNTLTYDFVQFGKDYGVLALSWEKKMIPFKIQVDAGETVLANIRKQLKAGQDQSWQGLNAAANYCAQNNVNHEEALGWAEKSIKLEKNIQNMSTKALLLYKTGEKKSAFKVTDELAEMADINQLNQLGYQMLQMEIPDKAVEYFELNVKRNPEDANCHDSLGEGYMAIGENKKAVKSFKKSLSLNPPDNVRQNSLMNLKKLGVDHPEH